MAKDYKLIEQLRANAPELLKILSANGVDVSKYKDLSEEIKAKEQAKKKRPALPPEQQEINRQKRKQRELEKRHKLEREQEYLKGVALMRLLEFDEDNEEKSTAQITLLPDIAECIRAEEQTKKDEEERKQAEIMKAIKEIALTVAPDEIQKEKEQSAIISLRAVATSIKLEITKAEREKQAKASFIKYYCDNWFFMLLDLMQKQPREKRSKTQ